MLSSLDHVVREACGVWGKTLVVSFQVELDREFAAHIADRYARSDVHGSCCRDRRPDA
ncbi:MAG: hypothetical protein HGA79_07275 [Anaerolineales bacterium]|nr:hypothetical protein [Anaerolineales bacterium]